LSIQLGRFSSSPYSGHAYEATDFIIKELNFTMRTTARLTKLAGVATDILKKKKNTFKERKLVNSTPAPGSASKHVNISPDYY
jgi:hypothetical protein